MQGLEAATAKSLETLRSYYHLILLQNVHSTPKKGPFRGSLDIVCVLQLDVHIGEHNRARSLTAALHRIVEVVERVLLDKETSVPSMK